MGFGGDGGGGEGEERGWGIDEKIMNKKERKWKQKRIENREENVQEPEKKNETAYNKNKRSIK